MLKIGDYNDIAVIEKVDFGVYLGSPEEKVLLPRKYVDEGTEIGDIKKVFIYKDSEDRIIATTAVPKAKVGEFAYLEVKEVNNFGAFLDWGLEKDLFVPYREQTISSCRAADSGSDATPSQQRRTQRAIGVHKKYCPKAARLRL
jgi:predicted RNA-binding protein (virulence factor B family)